VQLPFILMGEAVLQEKLGFQEKKRSKKKIYWKNPVLKKKTGLGGRFTIQRLEG
jgi:hypothetical protein